MQPSPIASRRRSPRRAPRWLHAAGIALALCVGSAACRATVMVRAEPSAGTIAVAQDPAQVRDAVARALRARRFVLEADAPGTLAARYERRDQMLRVVVQYTDAQYVVRIATAEGFATQPARDGAMMIDERAVRMVRGLRASIDTEIERAIRARADATQRDLDFQRARQNQLNAPPPPPAAASAGGQQGAPGQGGGGVDPGVVAAAAASVLVPIAAQAAANAAPAQGYSAQRSQIQSSQTITCCINGALYNCPSQAAFQQCISLGSHPCTPAGRCN